MLPLQARRRRESTDEARIIYLPVSVRERAQAGADCESRRALLRAQGVYYAATGVWSLLSLGTFQKVTGPKTDRWLVKTVGALVLASGASMAVASREREQPDSMTVLAAGSASALAAVDIWYSMKGRISKIYLLDAVVELGILALWLAAQSRAATERLDRDMRQVARPYV